LSRAKPFSDSKTLLDKCDRAPEKQEKRERQGRSQTGVAQLPPGRIIVNENGPSVDIEMSIATFET
jgi:hypothetical protein